MDLDEEILEYFEENDWDMSIEEIEKCAEKLQTEFGNEDEAVEYVHGYLNSIFDS